MVSKNWAKFYLFRCSYSISTTKNCLRSILRRSVICLKKLCFFLPSKNFAIFEVPHWLIAPLSFPKIWNYWLMKFLYEICKTIVFHFLTSFFCFCFSYSLSCFAYCFFFVNMYSSIASLSKRYPSLLKVKIEKLNKFVRSKKKNKKY